MDNRDPEKNRRNLTRTGTYNKITGYMVNIKESTAFLCTSHEQLDTEIFFF